MTSKTPRKDLDNSQFLKLRQTTDRISDVLNKRLKAHLTILKSLFIPRKLFGAFITNAAMEDVPGSEKAFAQLKEQYVSICATPFELPKKLDQPLPPISNTLEAIPFQYTLDRGDGTEKPTTITCPTRWILSYQNESSLNRLRSMLAGAEPRHTEQIRQTLINHLAMVLFLKSFPALEQLLDDLRYDVSVTTLSDLGGLPVVVLNAPLDVFLPSDDFILQITQLSGVPAFQEIIDLDAVENMPDPLRNLLMTCID